jgi:hypothetical protein
MGDLDLPQLGDAASRAVRYTVGKLVTPKGVIEMKRKYAELGMLFGPVVGGGLGVVLFASTGQVLYIVLAGVDKARSEEDGTGE